MENLGKPRNPGDEVLKLRNEEEVLSGLESFERQTSGIAVGKWVLPRIRELATRQTEVSGNALLEGVADEIGRAGALAGWSDWQLEKELRRIPAYLEILLPAGETLDYLLSVWNNELQGSEFDKDVPSSPLKGLPRRLKSELSGLPPEEQQAHADKWRSKKTKKARPTNKSGFSSLEAARKAAEIKRHRNR